MILAKFILFFIGLPISMLLLIAIFGRKERSRKGRLFMFLSGNAIFIASALLYPENDYRALVILGLTVIVLDMFALNKIFSGENPDQKMLNEWHDDPNNWRFGIFYFNPKDKRIFPPKKVESLGWTINFANPYSILIMVVIIAITVVLTQAFPRM